MRLENFGPGRDRGIDLRYAEDRANHIVVQCKHYARSTWADLRRSLESEIAKVQFLAPARYIVVTSRSMTPDQKTWVSNSFAPYCRGPADVLGAEDLNNLLGRHADVEARHHKLWLTSVPILQRIVNSEVFADQASELDHITRKVSRFVANDSLRRALTIINEGHFCVITGVPGIGKTTLAEMLVIDHLSRGFDCFRIWDDVSDARRVFRAATNQLFYYDDFLGKTGLHVPGRNEDERLLRLIGDVVNSSHHRLILTSRDYILHQATAILEGLDRADLDPARCVVSLADYTQRIRAEILYNHLYHSGIPQEYINALIEARAYRKIVRHSNYSPRIIEAMTSTINVRDVSPHQYSQAFLENLGDPRRLWEIAYHSHLTFAAQDALLVIATLSDEVGFADAEVAFEAFHRGRCARYGQPSTPYDWKRALKELEGTFLTVSPNHGTITIKFHNPSVRDFIEGHLRHHTQDVGELVSSASFTGQLVRLAQILSSSQDRSWVPDAVHRFLTIFSCPSGAARVVQFGSQSEWEEIAQSPVVRLIALAPLVAMIPAAEGAIAMETANAMVAHHLESHVPDREELTRLMREILENNIPHTTRADSLFGIVFSRAYSDLDAPDLGLDAYDALVAFADDYPEIVGDELRSDLVRNFGPLAELELDELPQLDPELQLNVYDQLASLAERLGVEMTTSRDSIMEDLPYSPDDGDEYSRFSSYGNDDRGTMSDADLDSMFDGLVH